MHFHDGAIEIRRISKHDAETRILFTIDFLLVTESTKQIWRDRVPIEWEHGIISTVSREGLIDLKRLSGGCRTWLILRGWKVKVDMSPQAVTQRLKLLDQLWALSVKLMQAKRPPITKRSRREDVSTGKHL